MGEALRYAWRGSGPFWLAGWVQLLGAFGAGLGLLDVPLPFQGNALWSKAASQIVGGIAGAGIVFIARLAVWYARRLAQPYLRAKLGVQMWPILLMASGMFLFVVLFGAGAIWAMLQPTSLGGGASPYVGSTHNSDVGNKLNAIDEVRDFIEHRLGKARYEFMIFAGNARQPAQTDPDGFFRQVRFLEQAYYERREELPKLAEKYSYFDGIPGILNSALDVQPLRDAINNLLSVIHTKDNGVILMQERQFGELISKYGAWEVDAVQRLKGLRQGLSR